MVRRKRKREADASRERRYSVRGVRRQALDIEKFSKALLGLVLADNERQAQAEHAAESRRSTSTPAKDESPGGGAPDA